MAAQKKEPVRGSKITAAVVYNGKIISVGENQYKSDPFQLRFAKNQHSIYIHAEISAIKRALKVLPLKKLQKSTLYIIRAKQQQITREWEYGLAKPCIGCQRCIAEFGIKNIVYSNNGNTVTSIEVI